MPACRSWHAPSAAAHVALQAKLLLKSGERHGCPSSGIDNQTLMRIKRDRVIHAVAVIIASRIALIPPITLLVGVICFLRSILVNRSESVTCEIIPVPVRNNLPDREGLRQEVASIGCNASLCVHLALAAYNSTRECHFGVARRGINDQALVYVELHVVLGFTVVVAGRIALVPALIGRLVGIISFLCTVIVNGGDCITGEVIPIIRRLQLPERKLVGSRNTFECGNAILSSATAIQASPCVIADYISFLKNPSK